MELSSEDRKELRNYAWVYFDRHAEQRLKTFNFYLVLSGALVAGIVSFKDNLTSAWPLFFLLSFVSFVFSKLDSRNRVLTKHSEEALKLVEDSMELPDEEVGVPHRCKLFRREEYESTQKPRYPGTLIFSAELSYTQCFRCIFMLFGWGGFLLGVVLAIMSMN